MLWAIREIASGTIWKTVKCRFTKEVSCPQQKLGSNDCGLFAVWFISVIHKYGAWTPCIRLPSMFQRPTIIESILERVERTHHISRPDIHEVVSSLDRLDRELSKDDLNRSSCKRMRNNDIGAYPGTKSHSSKDLFVSPAYDSGCTDIGPSLDLKSHSSEDLFVSPTYSVGCGENNVTWKCDTLPDVADLSLPFPMEELHPEGRKCKTIRYPLTPDRIQCFVNNRLFDRKVRTTTEIISCLLNQYGRMSLPMVHFAVCLEPDQTNRRRTFRKSIRECLDNKSMYL
jgi:hypothetical protein